MTFRIFLLLISLQISSKALAQQPIYVDIAKATGLNVPNNALSVSAADYDSDGDEDFMVISKLGESHFYENNGNGIFHEKKAYQLGIPTKESAQISAWLDINNDGHSDLYLGNQNDSDQILLNHGDGTFTDISFAAGITNTGTPKSINFIDFDLNGFLDIYVINENKEGILYSNRGNLFFEDATLKANLTNTLGQSDAHFFDYDQDGDSDLYLSYNGSRENQLFQNDGMGFFKDVSQESHTNITFSGSTKIHDFDYNGTLDIGLFQNEQMVCLLNDLDFNFEKQAFPTSNQDSNVLLNTWVSSNNQALKALINQNTSNWVSFKFISTLGNYFAIGTRFEIELENGQKLVQEISSKTVDNFQSTSVQYFNLNDSDKIKQLKIWWSDGTVESYQDITANKMYMVTENEGIVERSKTISGFEDGFRSGPIVVDQNTQHPIDESTEIQFELLESDHVQLVITNSTGQEIARLMDEDKKADVYNVTWNVNDSTQPSENGIYFYTISTNDYSVTKKMTFNLNP